MRASWRTVIENQMVGGIDALQIQHLRQRGADLAELGLIYKGHDKQGRASVEMVTVAAETVAATAGVIVFLQHRDVQSTTGQVNGGCDATHAGAYDEGSPGFHGFLEAAGWEVIGGDENPSLDKNPSPATKPSLDDKSGPVKLNREERTRPLILRLARKLLRSE